MQAKNTCQNHPNHQSVAANLCPDCLSALFQIVVKYEGMDTLQTPKCVIFPSMADHRRLSYVKSMVLNHLQMNLARTCRIVSIRNEMSGVFYADDNEELPNAIYVANIENAVSILVSYLVF